jgi:hypothetical protein
LQEFYTLYRDTIVLDKLAEASYHSRQLKEYLEALTKQKEEDLLESEGELPDSKAPTNQDFVKDANKDLNVILIEKKSGITLWKLNLMMKGMFTVLCIQ